MTGKSHLAARLMLSGAKSPGRLLEAEVRAQVSAHWGFELHLQLYDRIANQNDAARMVEGVLHKEFQLSFSGGGDTVAYVGVIIGATAGPTTLLLVGRGLTWRLEDGRGSRGFGSDRSVEDMLRDLLERSGVPHRIAGVATVPVLPHEARHGESTFECIVRLAARAGLVAYYDGSVLALTNEADGPPVELGPEDLETNEDSVSVQAGPVPERAAGFSLDGELSFKAERPPRAPAGSGPLARAALAASRDLDLAGGVLYAAKTANRQDLQQVLELEQAIAQAGLVTLSRQTNHPLVQLGRKVTFAHDPLASGEWLPVQTCLHWEPDKFAVRFLAIPVAAMAPHCGLGTGQREVPASAAGPAAFGSRQPLESQGHGRGLTDAIGSASSDALQDVLASFLDVATVLDCADPQKRGRVQLGFDWDSRFQPWAPVAFGMAGKDRGSFWVPRRGELVLVGFLRGSLSRPVVLNGLYHAAAMPPMSEGDPSSKITLARTANGTEITLLDDPEHGELRVKLPQGKGELSMRLGKEPEVTVRTAGRCSVEADRIGFSAKTFGIEAEEFDVKAGTVSIKGRTRAEVSSDGPVNVQSKATVKVKGRLITLN